MVDLGRGGASHAPPASRSALGFFSWRGEDGWLIPKSNMETWKCPLEEREYSYKLWMFLGSILVLFFFFAGGGGRNRFWHQKQSTLQPWLFEKAARWDLVWVAVLKQTYVPFMFLKFQWCSMFLLFFWPRKYVHRVARQMTTDSLLNDVRRSIRIE